MLMPCMCNARTPDRPPAICVQCRDPRSSLGPAPPLTHGRSYEETLLWPVLQWPPEGLKLDFVKVCVGGGGTSKPSNACAAQGGGEKRGGGVAHSPGGWIVPQRALPPKAWPLLAVLQLTFWAALQCMVSTCAQPRSTALVCAETLVTQHITEHER